MTSIEKYRPVKDWLREYKCTLKCEVCGENHPQCLDFHHKDETNKLGAISELIRNKKKKEIIIEEIAKCRVLCANCHRKLHFPLDTI